MYLDQKVTIFCTDRDTKSEGKIVRMNNLGIDVEISGAIIKFKKTKSNLYVGSMAGLEFTIKT